MNAIKPTIENAGTSGPDLIELQRRLTGWRGRRGKQGPLPQWLWESAAQLACEHGVSYVARVLRIDFYKLKRLASALGSEPGGAMVPPGFVELSASAPPELKRPCATSIELSDARGRKLRIVASSELSHWVALARALWEQER